MCAHGQAGQGSNAFPTLGEFQQQLIRKEQARIKKVASVDVFRAQPTAQDAEAQQREYAQKLAANEA